MRMMTISPREKSFIVDHLNNRPDGSSLMQIIAAVAVENVSYFTVTVKHCL